MATPLELVQEIINHTEELRDNLDLLLRDKTIDLNQLNTVQLAESAFGFWRHISLAGIKKAFGIED